MVRPDDILCPRPEGLYCAAGDFHIDPVRPVPRAVVTHGHSDHATAGHGAVMATQATLDIMRLRLGPGFAGTLQEAGTEAVQVGGARVRFHPAGHVLGSAQIGIEAQGLRFTVTGDYKRRADPSCEGFEPVPCDILVTEATFGLPVFRHPDPAAEIGRLLASLARFPERAHLVGAYSLGKAQRLIRLLRDAGHDRVIHIHGALRGLCAYYESRGVALGQLGPATLEAGRRGDFAGAVIIAPPSAFGTPWAQRFPDPLPVFASGWMSVRARARQRGVELPLVISDHCDWDELTATITELAPAETWVTHGREDALLRWCALNGHAARPLNLVGYADEAD